MKKRERRAGVFGQLGVEVGNDAAVHVAHGLEGFGLFVHGLDGADEGDVAERGAMGSGIDGEGGARRRRPCC